jgi:hypothetical protein
MKASKTPKSLPVGTFWPYFIHNIEEERFVVGIVKEDGLLHVAAVEDVMAVINKQKDIITALKDYLDPEVLKAFEEDMAEDAAREEGRQAEIEESLKYDEEL